MFKKGVDIMAKAKILLFIIGAIILSSISVCGTYFALVATKSIDRKKEELVFSVADSSKEYDAIELKANKMIEEPELPKGYTYKADYTGTITEVGTTMASATVTIFDNRNVDVTDNYDIVVNPGILTIYEKDMVNCIYF